METKAQGLGYRIGSGFKRLRSFLKKHESRLVRKAGQSYPKYGVRLARLLFLSIKVGLVILAIASMAVALYIALLALIVAVLVMVFNRKSDCSASDEYNKYWEQVNEESHYICNIREDGHGFRS